MGGSYRRRPGLYPILLKTEQAALCGVRAAL